MVQRTRASVAAVCLMLFGIPASAGGQQQQCRAATLPANVDLAPALARVVQRIHARSPTFRAQCERIAAASNLQVRVRIDPLMPGRCRAFTVVTRRNGQIRADVHLPPGRHLVELVAHEFEHLIEQIEGLDLRALARIRGSGVREVDRELFETDRAQAAGRLVAGEATWRRSPDAN